LRAVIFVRWSNLCAIPRRNGFAELVKHQNFYRAQLPRFQGSRMIFGGRTDPIQGRDYSIAIILKGTYDLVNLVRAKTVDRGLN
jgi:hypothetical protein